MKSDMQDKDFYERPRMEIILLDAKNPVLTSCSPTNEPSDSCPNGDSNGQEECNIGYEAPIGCTGCDGGFVDCTGCDKWTGGDCGGCDLGVDCGGCDQAVDY